MGTRVIAGRYTLEVPERPRPGCAVWRGRDTTTGAAVVVTLLDRPIGAALAAVRHPSLPVVLDHDDTWAVTPERSGVPVAPADPDAVADLGAALADALAALHERGLAQGPFALGDVVADEVGPPRFEDLATGDQPDDDIRRLGELLRAALGVGDRAEPLAAGVAPRMAGLLMSMASIAPPSAADARDALRRIARGAEDPLPLAPPAPPRRRGLKVLVALLAVAVVALAVVAVARVVDRRDAGTRAAATSLPGPVTTATATVEGGATTEAVEPPPPVGPSRSPRPLRIASITALDPHGDIGENSDQARRAIDRSPTTGWSTELYKQGVIERKGGVGLQLVLATPARVRRVVIRSAPVGATVRIYAVRGPIPRSTPRDWPAVSADVELRRRVATVPVRRRAPATALLVWIVGLPTVPGGYGVRIDDVRVIGVPTGA